MRKHFNLMASLAICCVLALAACQQQEPTETSSAATSSQEAAAANSTATQEQEPTQAGSTATNVAPEVESFVLPGESVFPEGVAYEPATGNFFVGSTTDGTIYRGNVGNGSEQVEVFLEGNSDGREAITGLKVDEQGRLFVAGRFTGRVFVYNAASGELIKALETPPSENTIINDVAVTEDAAYFTDSFRPTLFRVPLTGDSVGEMEPWLDFADTAIEYEEGFNLNGIAVSPDGQYLLTVQYNTGDLFRIEIANQTVAQVELEGESLRTGDGLVLDGQTLYVVRGGPGDIVPVALSEDYTNGVVGDAITDPSFRAPTTIAKYDNRLLVVNSQLDMAGSGGSPELPFTLSNIAIP